MATFAQGEQFKLGLNPNLQNTPVTGEAIYYQDWAGRRWYSGTGNPVGEITAYPGDVCITDEGIFTCNGDGAGGTGTIWFGSTNSPSTATCVANTEKTVTHNLGYIPNVWFVNGEGELVQGIDVYDVTITSFKITSLEAGTVYYR